MSSPPARLVGTALFVLLFSAAGVHAEPAEGQPPAPPSQVSMPSKAALNQALSRRSRFVRGQVRDVEALKKAVARRQPSRDNAALIKEALAHRNVRYRWGGASRSGFDCSGFTLYVMKKGRGIKLPHSASAQARLGVKVARKDLQPGDLVFFHTYRRGIGHVGVYIGNNKFVHASSGGHRVRVNTLTGYYDRRYVTARRYSSPKAARKPVRKAK